jgi:hypothetical protein
MKSTGITPLSIAAVIPYRNTRYLDYWYWDYGTTEPYAGDTTGNFVRKTSLDVPMVGATVSGAATTWTSQPFLTRPNLDGTITGYDLTVKLAATAADPGPNNIYSAGFTGFTTEVFSAFIWGLGALNNPLYVNNFGQILPPSVVLNQIYTVTAMIRDTGTTYTLDGVDVPGVRAYTTSQVPDWIQAFSILDNNTTAAFQTGGHEFKIIVTPT